MHRVSPEAEEEGLDLAVHGESAYELTSVGGGAGTYAPASAPARQEVSA